MKLSSRGRLFIDVVLLAGIIALSFLPAVGTRQTHFRVAAGTLRIFAGVYAVVAAAGVRRLISARARTLLDSSAAAILALMAWAETFPAGNHVGEIGIYSGVAVILAALAVINASSGMEALILEPAETR